MECLQSSCEPKEEEKKNKGRQLVSLHDIHIIKQVEVKNTETPLQTKKLEMGPYSMS